MNLAAIKFPAIIGSIDAMCWSTQSTNIRRAFIAAAVLLFGHVNPVVAQEGSLAGRKSSEFMSPQIAALRDSFGDRSAAPLGLKPHQVEKFVNGYRYSGFSALSIGVIQSVPNPTDLLDMFPTNKALKDFYSVCKDLTVAVDLAISEDRPLSASVARQYDDSCLGKLGSMAPNVRAWIERRLVLVGWEQDGAVAWPHCTGLLVSARHVVTAKHCFYDNRQQLIPWAQLRVFQLLTPAAGLSLLGRPTDASQASLALTYSQSKVAVSGDVAFAMLASSVDLADAVRPSIQSAPLPSGQRMAGVVVPGLSGIVANALVAQHTPSSAASFIRVDRSGGCFVQRVGGAACYVHSCHTSSGTSGAPVLAFDQAGATLKVTLIAIHSGARGQATDCPAQIPATLNLAAPNLANFPDGSMFVDPAVVVQLEGVQR